MTKSNLSQMFSPFSHFFPFGHEPLGGWWDSQVELSPQDLNQTLLVQHQRYVIDGRTVVYIDHLEQK